jgi:NADP-dependent 3-hydroxy acid dehydrogenase YdfG
MTASNARSSAAAPQVVLITGATAGIGRQTALHLAAAGYHVIATGRRVAELEALRRDAPGRLSITPLDVTSAASIAAAVAEVDRLTDGHGVDVLVNNAGFGLLGPLTEISRRRAAPPVRHQRVRPDGGDPRVRPGRCARAAAAASSTCRAWAGG